MLRKILSFFFALFMFLPTAHSAEMVNVEYIHQYLNARWGIDLPYNPELKNPKVAANMEYLLTVVDIANEYLNGEKTTSYGTGEYATKLAADTIATNTAIDTLVRGPFTMTINGSEFSINIGAAGTFVIDWGDGEFETIKDKPVGKTTYTHSYAISGEYEIKLSGRATGYSDSSNVAAISFYTNASNAQKIYSISGSLGKIFPTLPDGSQPRFYQTFMRASNLTEIPAYLFGELNGDGAPSMFDSTFSNCDSLTTIEGPLFSGTLVPASSMFFGTFYNSGVTRIPENLFGNLSGGENPIWLFYQTFTACSELTTIDGPLFSGTITPGNRMFFETFGSSGLTEIPAYLFGNMTGDGAEDMFAETFSSSNLTTINGPLFGGKITPGNNMFFRTFYDTPITSIPENLFAGISGAPAEVMFAATFMNTQITSVPANLFGELNGNGAPNMFVSTFSGCDQLQTVEGPLFSGTITPAEEMFSNTFYESGLTSIPANLFGELNGNGAPNMFDSTFYGCDQLQTVEGPLFSGAITPAEYMFNETFYRSGLTSIPADLFAGVRGAPAEYMFNSTFRDTPITSIPENLFAGISGAPATSMFAYTFDGTQITSIPENLFAGISGPAADRMFYSTFASCTSLTGPSARINGQYLYEIWPDVSTSTYTYRKATGLSDYAQIPDNWK